MMGAIAAFFAKSVLMQSPIGGFLKMIGGLLGKVPAKAWLILAVLAALFVGYKVHEHKRVAFGQERYTTGFKAGYAAAVADGKKLNAKTDKKTAAIAVDVRRKKDAEDARTNSTASDLLMRGPGKASARCPAVPAAASGPRPAAAAPDAAGDSLPPADGFAKVPWGWLVSHGQSCDLSLNENKAWRAWWTEVYKSWPKP